MNVSQTIYLLDDDDSARRGLKHLLYAAGYKVEVFSTSEEFIQVQTFDNRGCLVVDAWVPGFLELNQLQREINIPMIVISARDNKESRDRARESNAVGFFRKPVDGQALLDAIDWALQSYR